MRVLLINPDNPVVTLTQYGKWDKLNKYRVWKPLGLLTLANLTPAHWDVEVVDENLGPVDYERVQRPDVVGLTAFTCQATRAYQVAALFRAKGVPVIMGGIHASMCVEEALQHADAVVTGEAEEVWAQVLADVEAGRLQRRYTGGLAQADRVASARHDLLAGKYYFGAIQTTRGCPLCCNFCSVTAFNGGRFRHRPVEQVIEELRHVKEKLILFVDDNLIGTRSDHIAYSKALFRAMIREGLTTSWICQATINFADDEELLDLARRAGCVGVFIGFESPTEAGLIAVHKKFNIVRGKDIPASVRRIQKHRISVVGSFIMGIDTDEKGIGEITARACDTYGLDAANVMILTPLPGTALYREMAGQRRITATNYPEDWRYYTLCHPVAQYRNFSWPELGVEIHHFNENFYSYRRIVRRIGRLSARLWNNPRALAVGVVANLTYRFNHIRDVRIGETREAAAPASSAGIPAKHRSRRRTTAGSA